MSDPREFLESLEADLRECRYAEVGEMIDGLNPGDFSDSQAKTMLGLIRRKRLFNELEKAAGLFFLAGRQAPEIRRQWAQALLDQNRITQGLVALQDLLQQVADDPKEGPEVRGLIGRAFKQRFVNEGDRDDLLRSIREYRHDWTANPQKNRWHGINLVALLKRAQAEGIDPGIGEDPESIAGRILDDIRGQEQDTLTVWDYGTAMEAAVALNRKQAALRWAKAYVRHPGADAFELGSTLRQMKEVWRLEGEELGAVLIPVLECELLGREGGSILLSTKPESASGFEAVYGPEGSFRFEWMDNLYERSRSIGRVFDPVTGKPCGTGFLVKAVDLRSTLGAGAVFATNSHVVSADSTDEPSLAPHQASAEFTRLPGRPKLPLRNLIFTSPRTDLDVTLLEIDPAADLEPLEVTLYSPAAPDSGEVQRVYVVGHPQGREMEVTLYDNSLAEYEGCYVRYRSPTQEGMSGSPVFNRRWQSFAIHHRALPKRQLNEGVLFQAIHAAP